MKRMNTGNKAVRVSIGKAEFKITIVTFYYTLLGVGGVVSYTTKNATDLALYFICESTGLLDCRENLASLEDVNVLHTVAVVMLSLLPAVTFLFSCDTKACRKKLKTRS